MIENFNPSQDKNIDIPFIVIDSFNQFMQFYFFKEKNIDFIKNLIKNENLKSFREYILYKFKDEKIVNVIIDDINHDNPDLMNEYNLLIEKLNSDSLTKENFILILNKQNELLKKIKDFYSKK